MRNNCDNEGNILAGIWVTVSGNGCDGEGGGMVW